MKQLPMAALLVVVALVVSACGNTRTERTVSGAGIGALAGVGAGALIGPLGLATGALVGAGVGAGVGFAGSD